MFLEGEYNYFVSALSIIVAFLSALASINIFSRLIFIHGRHKIFWLVAGAIVMGVGIWSFHFIALLSFNLPIHTSITVGYTLLSVCISVIISYIFLFIMIQEPMTHWKQFFAGCLFVVNMVGIHFLSVEAVEMRAIVSYDRRSWLFAGLIVCLAAFMIVRLFLVIRSRPGSLVKRSTIAIGITSVLVIAHYFVMQTNRFYIDEPNFTVNHSINTFSLVLVLIAIAIIFIAFWGIMFFDRTVLERMAYEDPLTHLANRHEMNRFFEKFRMNQSIAILFIDMDHFKVVNDTFGHQVGDQVIQVIAHRLYRLMDEKQLVYRIGGDEFLVIVQDQDDQVIRELAGQVLGALNHSIMIDDQTVYITGSIGVSVSEDKKIRMNELLQRADIAMFHAKLNGKNQFCFYDEAIGEEERRRARMLNDLRKAVEDEQFYLVYQPKWHVKKQELYGFEALLRWKHPELGSIPPKEFIPLAEETGQIIPLTKWIIAEACTQGMKWYEQGLQQPISVNLSAKLFQSDYLVIWLEDILQQTQFPARLLEFEITESIVLHDIDEVTLQLTRIRQRGVRVAMDDFGVGYSSIGLLDQIPIDAIKLDRLFMENLDQSNKRAIIHAIIMMADTLHLDVIAEGVETERQVNTLLQLGCFIIQGYYYGRPLKVKQVAEWVNTHTSIRI